MATTAATTLEEALNLIKPNVHFLHENGADLKALLKLWRESFFVLLDVDNVDQKVVNQWSVPTLHIENGLPATTQHWFLLNKVIGVVSNTLAAARWNGFVPDPGLEATMVVAFNTAWT